MSRQEQSDRDSETIAGLDLAAPSAHTEVMWPRWEGEWPAWDDFGFAIEYENAWTAAQQERQANPTGAETAIVPPDAATAPAAPVRSARQTPPSATQAMLSRRIKDVLDFIDPPARQRRRPLIIAIVAFLMAAAVLAAAVIPELRSGFSDTPTTEPAAEPE